MVLLVMKSASVGFVVDRREIHRAPKDPDSPRECGRLAHPKVLLMDGVTVTKCCRRGKPRAVGFLRNGAQRLLLLGSARGEGRSTAGVAELRRLVALAPAEILAHTVAPRGGNVILLRASLLRGRRKC
jgi:hypothetical protein